MRNLFHLAGRLYNTPLLISPEKLATIRAIFARQLETRGPAPLAYFDDEEDVVAAESDAPKEPEDIAVISIVGTLVHRAAGMDAMSGMLSYSKIGAQLAAAVADPAVKGIVVDIDSPGGEVSGCFDLSDKIREAAAEKPIYAVSNEIMFSAAYALGCAATRLYVGRTAGMGSIGVIITHCDMSEADKMNGLKYTMITSGSRKADFSPHKALSDEAYATLKSDVDRCAAIFFATVARNRNLSIDAVAAQEAGLFFGADAITAGLADQIGGLEDALRDMAVAVSAEAPEIDPGLTVGAAQIQDLAIANAKFCRGRVSVGGPPRQRSADGAVSAIWSARVHAEAVDAGIAQPSARLRVRSAPALHASRLISGCFAPYGQLSTDLGGFREVYEPGCFAESMANDDVRALFNHNPDYVLGRKSAETLRLFEDARGAQIEIDAPETNWADDLLVSMGRKDITQQSAAFYIEKASWETRAGVGRVRHIEKARLVEVSIHTRPAYDGTTAEVQQQTSAQSDVLAEASLAAHSGPRAELEALRQRFEFAQYV
jgi:HK97 family phage prohead protease